jgi:hypothetical protein
MIYLDEPKRNILRAIRDETEAKGKARVSPYRIAATEGRSFTGTVQACRELLEAEFITWISADWSRLGISLTDKGREQVAP